MAKCPCCDYKLKIWHIRAECPSCGANIPNYNWEERLEQDADVAEAAWKVFRARVAAVKSTFFGGVLKVIRFAFTFVPLVILPLPLIKLALSLPFTDFEPASYSIINIALGIIQSYNIKNILSAADSEIFKTPATVILASLILIVLAILFAVLNFVFMLTGSFSMKNAKNVFCCAVSTVCFIALAAVLMVFKSTVVAANPALISFSLGPAVFVGIGLFTFNLIINIVLNRSLKKQRLTMPAF